GHSKAFGHQFATAFTANIVQHRIDNLAGRICSPVIKCLLVHICCRYRGSEVTIYFSPVSERFPILCGSTIQGIVFLIISFYIVEISLCRPENNRSGVATAIIRKLCAIESTSFAYGVTCSVAYLVVSG